MAARSINRDLPAIEKINLTQLTKVICFSVRDNNTFLSELLNFGFWICWLARTSHRPISQTAWLKVFPRESKSNLFLHGWLIQVLAYITRLFCCLSSLTKNHQILYLKVCVVAAYVTSPGWASCHTSRWGSKPWPPASLLLVLFGTIHAHNSLCQFLDPVKPLKLLMLEIYLPKYTA
jgi:hypothetical protein